MLQLNISLLQGKLRTFAPLLVEATSYRVAAEIDAMLATSIRRFETMGEWYDKAKAVQNLLSQRWLAERQLARLEDRLGSLEDRETAVEIGRALLEQQRSSVAYVAMYTLRAIFRAFEFSSLEVWMPSPADLEECSGGATSACLRKVKAAFDARVGSKKNEFLAGDIKEPGADSDKRVVFMQSRDTQPLAFERLALNRSILIDIALPDDLSSYPYYDVRIKDMRIWMLGTRWETTPHWVENSGFITIIAKKVGPSYIVDKNRGLRAFFLNTSTVFDFTYSVSSEKRFGVGTGSATTSAGLADLINGGTCDGARCVRLLDNVPFGTWQLDVAPGPALETVHAVRIEFTLWYRSHQLVSTSDPPMMWIPGVVENDLTINDLNTPDSGCAIAVENLPDCIECSGYPLARPDCNPFKHFKKQSPPSTHAPPPSPPPSLPPPPLLPSPPPPSPPPPPPL